MIIYFTGTGNSRHLAKLLADELNDTVTDATALIKAGKHPDFSYEKPYIFVSPVYAWRLPRVFESWMKKCTFSGNKKAYFVIDCGDSIGAAGNYIEKFAANVGFEYMGTAQIVMPENYIVMFEAPPADMDKKIIAVAEKKALRLCRTIADGAPLDKVKISFMGHIYSDIVNPMFYTFYIGAKKFYATDACISCGKCKDICMLNNIVLKGGKPAWGKDCTHCMACISKCPTNAIEYGKNTKGKRRYLCPKDKI